MLRGMIASGRKSVFEQAQALAVDKTRVLSKPAPGRLRLRRPVLFCGKSPFLAEPKDWEAL